ncbi:hypothetical protein BH09PSE1_BH09PSE1_29580 [soil metagenome]
MHDASNHTTVAAQASAGRAPAAPDEVWARVREDYLAGMSAPDCCRRHRVGLTALRNRASREGWRRTDQPWSPTNRLDPWDEGVELEREVDGDIERIEYRQLAHVADCRMMRAVLRGDAVEALRWHRLNLILEEREEALQRDLAQDNALALRRKEQENWAADAARKAGAKPATEAAEPVEADEAVDLDDADGVFSADRPAPDLAPGSTPDPHADASPDPDPGAGSRPEPAPAPTPTPAAYCASMPPSILNSVPVTNLDSSEARYSTA